MLTLRAVSPKVSVVTIAGRPERQGATLKREANLYSRLGTSEYPVGLSKTEECNMVGALSNSETLY